MNGITSPDLLPPAQQPPPHQQTGSIPPECYAGITKLLFRHRDEHVVMYRPIPAFALAASPWVHVDFYESAPKTALDLARHRYAIWAHTGDVYEVQDDGAVGDDPIFKP